jgi:hypothetical protein
MSESGFINGCSNIYYKYCYPLLFGEIRGPPIWPVIVISIIIFLAVAEIGSQSCQNGDCNHYKNLEKVGNNPTSVKMIDNIISRVNLNHTTVGWRRAMILSMILSIIILSMFYSGLPDGFDFFLVATILFIIMYLLSVWFQWHWWKAKDNKIESRLLNLRNEVKDIELKHYNGIY